MALLLFLNLSGMEFITGSQKTVINGLGKKKFA
jgi:hypothetical protein